jgi:phenylacetate-CoA ligase
MHLHARDLFCEFLDPETGEPAEPGGVGELVATQLGRHALPLVRYAPKDAYRLLEGTCSCGDPAPRVVFVGQVGVIRKIKGVLVHPAQIHAVTSQFPELGRFQVLVDHPAGERYERAVLRAGTVTSTGDPEALRRALAERVKATVLVQMDVELVPETEVPEAAGPPRFAEAMVKR